MSAPRRPTLLYLHDGAVRAAELEAWLSRFLDLVPIDGATALHGRPACLAAIDGILADWSPDFASAIPRLRRLVAPRRVPVVMLADVTPANRVAAIMMQADFVEPFPPSPAVLDAILSRWTAMEATAGPAAGADRPLPRAAEAPAFDIVASSRATGNGTAHIAWFEHAANTGAMAADRLMQPDPHPGLEIDDERHECLVNGESLQLPLTAFRLLRFLVDHRGSCCRRDALLDEIWGAAYVPSSDVVSTTVSELRKALTPYGLRDSIRTVRGVGYIFEIETGDRSATAAADAASAFAGPEGGT